MNVWKNQFHVFPKENVHTLKESTSCIFPRKIFMNIWMNQFHVFPKEKNLEKIFERTSFMYFTTENVCVPLKETTSFISQGKFLCCFERIYPMYFPREMLKHIWKNQFHEFSKKNVHAYLKESIPCILQGNCQYLVSCIFQGKSCISRGKC